MKLKIIPPRRPANILSSDEISAAEALIMLAHGRSSLSPATNYAAAAAKRKTAPVSDQNQISGMAHQCFICHKIFSSGQALGGHQTSHRKIKSSHRHISRPCNAAAAAPTSILNRISLCGKKRKHNNDYEGKLRIKMVSDSSDHGISNSGVTSDDEPASNTRVRLNIDLNLPPAPEFC